MNRLRPVLVSATLTLLLLAGTTAHAQSPNVSPNIFNVAIAPYNANTNGTVDDTAAIQQAVNDAIAYGNANGNPAVTVLLPAGTYLVAGGSQQNTQINIINSTNLTFEGAGTASTMIWCSRANSGHCFFAYGNTNMTIQNFSSDVQKLGTGLYDMGETQGTITAITRTHDSSAVTLTVQVETGYPSLSRSDIQNATSNGYGRVLWLQTDPNRLDFGDAPSLTGVAPTGSGATGTLTLNTGNNDLYVGEKWMIYVYNGGIWCDFGYGNSGTTTLQNVDYYGGAIGWMGDAGGSGNLNFNSVYCGPPPYQSDRLLTCLEGWGAVSGRLAFHITNSQFLQTWDDVFDMHIGQQTVLSQPTGSQVLISGTGDFRQGDVVEFSDNTNQPTGTYGYPAAIAQTPTVQNGNTLITLSQSVTVHNVGKDYFTDLSSAGTVTATNDTFNNTTGRHVYFFGGVSTVIQNCTFLDDTPLVLAGFDGGEAPSDVHNVTVTGCTFQNAAGVVIQGNAGSDTAPCGTNVTISGNRFLDGGRMNSFDSNAVAVKNVTGVTVANNWFDGNWGANIQLQYDANISVTGNTFLHVNQIAGSNPAVDTSVINLANVSGGSLSGNLLYGPGPYTQYLVQQGTAVTGVTGLADGVTDLDNPLAFYLSYDGLVAARPASGSVLDQAAWTGAAGQTWQALPTQTLAPALSGTPAGSFTLDDAGNGQYVGNAASNAAGASLVEENQNGATEQLWALGLIDNADNNIVNDASAYVFNVVGGSNSPGQALCQWYPGNAQNQNWEVVQAPDVVATTRLGTVTVNWPPVPYATGYSVKRATTATGAYTTLASNLSAGPYVDSAVTAGTTYYYVVTAAGLPVGNSQSNQVFATPGAAYTLVGLAQAFDAAGIEPDGWDYNGPGFDGYGFAYSSALTGSQITWGGAKFALGPPAVPDAAADQGQRIFLPPGRYSKLLILGAYLGSGTGSTGTFQPVITYADDSRVTLSQGMTNWCGTASQSGEANAATDSYRDEGNGTKQTITCYVHGYTIPLNPALGVEYLDLPSTGNVRILAMALSGLNRSVLAVGQDLLPGQYLASPNGKYILTQRADGDLVLYAGADTQHEGAIVWSSGYSNSGGGPYFTAMQGDGNLVTYMGTPGVTPQTAQYAVWSTGTNDATVTALQLTNTPEAQILDGTTVVWQKP